MTKRISISFSLLISVLLIWILVAKVSAVDISSARYTATITLQNTGSAGTELAVDVPLSGKALSDGGYIASNTLNAAIVDGTTQVPSQPPSLLQSMDGAVHDDGGVQTSYITEINNSVANDVPLLPIIPTINDSFYFGADNQFRILTVDITQPGSGVWDFAWEYWTGLTWTVVTTLDDRTSEFTSSGLKTVSFDLPSNWARTNVHVFASKYFLRARVTAFTSTTVQPLARQAFWETGTWWLFEDSINTNQQVTYTLALAATSTLVTNHQFFPGIEGYVTPDNAALELGSGNFTLTIEGYLNTDILTGSYLNKLGAISLFNSATSTIKLELNSLTSTTLTNVQPGYHTMTVTRGFSSISLSVLDVGSVTLPFTSTVNTSNAWQWGTQGTVSYFNSIRLTHPSILATPARTADNAPTEGITGQSYNRAMAFGTSTDVVYVWGGGSLGSGSFVTQLWKYTFSTNIWSLVSGGALPAGGEQYRDRTYGSSGNKLISTSSSVAGCDTRVYDITLNTWTLATAIACNGFGNTATTASNFYYFISSNGTSYFFSRLDINNPTGLWTTLATPTISQPNFGAMVYDSITNRIVYFSRDNGRVDYYDIVLNTWTNLGNIFNNCSPSTFCYPATAWWDTAQQSVVATSRGTTSPAIITSPMKVWRLVWDSISAAHFDQIGTWTDAEFNYTDSTTNGLFPAASISLSGNTRVIFGGGYTTIGSPGVVANRWWQATTAATTNINDLFYYPNELIGETLDDQSLNDVDATVSYPSGLPSQYVVILGPITPTGIASVTDIRTSSTDTIPQIPEKTVTGQGSLSTIPAIGPMMVFLSDQVELPIGFLFIILVTFIVAIVGTTVFMTTRSLVGGAMSMLLLLLFATNMATGGLIPWWVFLFAAVSVVGYLGWSHR